MIKKPLISIIIPCHNVEKYVEECINSVLNQDYENWECIAINDGSKDRTLEVLKKLEAKSNKIKVLAKQNSGPSDTRNMGIGLAKGDFIYFLDSDDVLTLDAIGSLVSSFENNDIIVGKTRVSTFSEKPVTKDHLSMVLHPKEGNITFNNQNYGVLIRTMESGLTPIPHNKLYRKDFIINNNLRFKPGILHEDEFWFFETMLFARNVKFINKETYFYRINNSNSITNNMSDRNLDFYIQVMEAIFEKYAQDKNYRLIASWYMVYMKKIFLDYAVREKKKLSPEIILRMETALKNCYIPIKKENFLSKNNEKYFKTLNILSLKPFNIIEKYYFRNPINSLRKYAIALIINYLHK